MNSFYLFDFFFKKNSNRLTSKIGFRDLRKEQLYMFLTQDERHYNTLFTVLTRNVVVEKICLG